jgi:hypothetical protein
MGRGKPKAKPAGKKLALNKKTLKDLTARRGTAVRGGARVRTGGVVCSDGPGEEIESCGH